MPRDHEFVAPPPLAEYGIGRTLTEESARAFMAAFDRVMPSTVQLELREAPGVTYATSDEFGNRNARHNPALAIARVEHTAIAFQQRGILKETALEPTPHKLGHLLLKNSTGITLQVQLKDRPEEGYAGGLLINGERSAVRDELNLPSPNSSPARGKRSRPLLKLGLITRGKHLVTPTRLAEVRQEVGNVLELNPVGAVPIVHSRTPAARIRR